MSLTRWKKSNSGGPGNYSPFSLYYEEDRTIVLNQVGPNNQPVASAGLVNYTFRGDSVTVFAAMDANGEVFPLVGLPCPPYYHETNSEAMPGNILTE